MFTMHTRKYLQVLDDWVVIHAGIDGVHEKPSVGQRVFKETITGKSSEYYVVQVETASLNISGRMSDVFLVQLCQEKEGDDLRTVPGGT